MSNIVDTVEVRIQIAILTAIDSIFAPKIELAIRSKNASSGRDATSVTANSERGEHVGVDASSQNSSGNNNTLHVSNVNDETRNNIPDELSELSVPETRFDRQTRTHHIYGPSILVEAFGSEPGNNTKFLNAYILLILVARYLFFGSFDGILQSVCSGSFQKK